METISVIVPTRNRPDQFSDFAKSLYENSEHPNHIELIALLDDDDKSYANTFAKFPEIKWIIGKREGLGPITTRGIKNSSGDIIFLCNDDVIVLTDKWDTKVRKAHGRRVDNVYLAGPNDMNQGSNLFVFPIFSRSVFNTLNQFTSYYSGAYIDTHIFEIFASLKHFGFDRFEFLENVNFKHNHFSVTGSKPDQTYLDREKSAEEAKFFSLVGDRLQSAENLKNLIILNDNDLTIRPKTVSTFTGIKIYLNGYYLPRTHGAKICLQFMARMLIRVLGRVIS
jgi:glycosyltransferase involved in cell wall biosynthesis